MGLSNYHKYRITSHARSRYRERIAPGASERAMEKHFITLMQDAVFLSKESDGCESWLHEGQEIVLIVAPARFQVVTIYRSNREDESVTEEPDRAQQLVAEAARKLYRDEEKRFWAQLGPLYESYGQLMDRLTRTTRHDYLAQGRQELDQLKQRIRQVEAKRREVLNGLESYMTKEES